MLSNSAVSVSGFSPNLCRPSFHFPNAKISALLKKKPFKSLIFIEIYELDYQELEMAT